MSSNSAVPAISRLRTFGTVRLLQPLVLVRRLPERLHDRRFWYVQALVLIATVPHYIIESFGYHNPFETLHGLTITLYILPLLFAAVSFGWEGAILTAIWSGFLTSPSTWIWERSEFHWVTELGQLGIALFVGTLVAWRVDLEARQRQRAEQTSAGLGLLNEVGTVLSQTMDAEQELPRVLHRLRSGLSCRSVWLYLEPEPNGTPLALVEVSALGPAVPPTAPANLHTRLSAEPGAFIRDGPLLVVRLLAEGQMIGSLAATASDGLAFPEEHVGLLTTVANQVGVAIENARLYRQRQESLRSYARQVTHAQEEERLRIARELHDETAQELVQLARRLEQLSGSGDRDQQRAVDELITMTRNTLSSVRRFARDLRPSVLDDLGLVAAIEMVVEEASGHFSGGAQVRVVGSPRRIERSVELALFRIAQEGLRNIDKHAGATAVDVELGFTGDAVSLSMTDDGKGFILPRHTSDLPRVGKLGVLGMRERAELVGGSFRLDSTPGAGTRLVVRMPALEQGHRASPTSVS